MPPKIYSQKKRSDILDVLHDPEASHDRRLWAAGFLKYAGFSMEEAAGLIANENHWTNYNPVYTQRQLSSVYHGPRSGLNMPDIRRGVSSRPPAAELSLRPASSRFPGLEKRIDGLDIYNRDFLQGSAEIVEEWRPDYYSYGQSPFLKPMSYPLYRGIEYADGKHVLSVIDLDAKGDLGHAWQVAQRLMENHTFRYAKFSGNRGFHLIDKIEGDREAAKRHARRLVADLDLGGVKFDQCMFHRRRLVRAYSVHRETGMVSVPVWPEDTLDSILKRAKRGRL